MSSKSKTAQKETSLSPTQQAEAFLQEHGWTQDNNGFWNDPRAGGESQQVDTGLRLKLDTHMGRSESIAATPIMQTHGPLGHWNYTLAGAVHLQNERNIAEGASVCSLLVADPDEEYLLSKGWKRVGMSLWNDPRASREQPKRVQVPGVFLSDRPDGKQTPLFQTVGPVPPWDFSTAEAVDIQRSRDELENK